MHSLIQFFYSDIQQVWALVVLVSKCTSVDVQYAQNERSLRPYADYQYQQGSNLTWLCIIYVLFNIAESYSYCNFVAQLLGTFIIIKKVKEHLIFFFKKKSGKRFFTLICPSS